MTKWETKLFRIHLKNYRNSSKKPEEEVTKKINELGEQGWEPFHFKQYYIDFAMGVYVAVWCKRPKEGEHYDRDSDRIS